VSAPREGGTVPIRSLRPLAIALVLVLAAGCTAAAEVAEPYVEMSAPAVTATTTPTVDQVTVDPCLLLTETEVEAALSVTIQSSRLQSDPLTRAFTFPLPERSCVYYGVAEEALGTPAPAASAVPSGPPFAAAAEELGGAIAQPGDDVLARARSDAERLERQSGPLELVVSVHPERLSRDQFETYYEWRLRQLTQVDRASEFDGLAAAVAGRGARFVEEATGRATDVGGIGDAARWYPALAQLHVLDGDVVFVVTSLKQSPMIAGMLFHARVEPTYDPPPEFVDLARLAVDRL
jgi:hypothetical protein